MAMSRQLGMVGGVKVNYRIFVQQDESKAFVPLIPPPDHLEQVLMETHQSPISFYGYYAAFFHLIFDGAAAGVSIALVLLKNAWAARCDSRSIFSSASNRFRFLFASFNCCCKRIFPSAALGQRHQIHFVAQQCSSAHLAPLLTAKRLRPA